MTIARRLKIGRDASQHTKDSSRHKSIRQSSLTDEHALGVFPDVSLFRRRVHLSQPVSQKLTSAISSAAGMVAHGSRHYLDQVKRLLAILGSFVMVVLAYAGDFGSAVRTEVSVDDGVPVSLDELDSYAKLLTPRVKITLANRANINISRGLSVRRISSTRAAALLWPSLAGGILNVPVYRSLLAIGLTLLFCGG
jgi:hypothetical protein